MNDYQNVSCYKRRSKKMPKKTVKRKGLIALSTLVFACILVILHIIYNVNPIVRSVSEQKVNAKINNIVNEAASEAFLNNLAYTDFVEISKVSDGTISLIQVNSVLINILARGIILKAQQEVDDIAINGVNVPFGSFSGITLLSGHGMPISINVLSMGAVTSEVRSEFESAGFNQTIHRVYIIISSSLKLILPGSDAVIEASIPLVVSETVIVGKIPTVLLQ